MTAQQQAYVNGFVKRAAEYGFSDHEALSILKKASEELGPFDAERAADMLGAEMKLKALARNKEEHPYHYYLNPFVGGPITEAITRLKRRHNAGLADDEHLLNHWLGGNLLNIYRGNEGTRNTIRDKFNEQVGEYSPE